MNDGDKRGIRLTDKQRLSWLRLIRSDNVGPVTFKELINQCGSAENAIRLLPEMSQRGGAKRTIRIATQADAERELEQIQAFGARLVGIGEPEYPSALRYIDGAPPLLTMKGNFDLVNQHAVGIVGSRNASISGTKLAGKLAMELGQAGYATISGLARGIDARVHHASIQTGTIAALAGGIDMPYPPENVSLYQDLCAGQGLVISEMNFGWKPIARDFPRRNRLIAGSALGLLVIEAAQRSGSLISARYAADFGRLVFAVPGSPLDPRASGTNGLIKDGAILVTDISDITDALAPISQIDQIEPPPINEDTDSEHDLSPPDENARQTIISAMGSTPVEIDDIIRHTGFDAQSVYLVLLELELAGNLQRHPGGLVSTVFDSHF